MGKSVPLLLKIYDVQNGSGVFRLYAVSKMRIKRVSNLCEMFFVAILATI